jgi:hypothetical protein
LVVIARELDSVNREPLFGASERQTSGAHPEPEYRPLPGKLTQAIDGRLRVGGVPVEGVVGAGVASVSLFPVAARVILRAPRLIARATD